MNIVNLIHIGDKVKNLDSMSPEERREIATVLNVQALATLGYRRTEEKTA